MLRKRLVVLAVGLFAAGAFTAGSATAEPSDACGSADPAAAVQTANGGIICLKTGVVNASVTADANPEGESYLVADGDSTNPDPLDGYIGLEGGPGGGGVVGCASGDYEPFA